VPFRDQRLRVNGTNLPAVLHSRPTTHAFADFGSRAQETPAAVGCGPQRCVSCAVVGSLPSLFNFSMPPKARRGFSWSMTNCPSINVPFMVWAERMSKKHPIVSARSVCSLRRAPVNASQPNRFSSVASDEFEWLNRRQSFTSVWHFSPPPYLVPVVARFCTKGSPRVTRHHPHS
jgi:hypothetical protein